MSDESIGTDMKKVVLALSLVMLAACMPYSSMTSPDPDMRLDGDEPEGYPRTVIVHYKGSCYRATESWVQGNRSNQRSYSMDQAGDSRGCCLSTSPAVKADLTPRRRPRL